MGIFVCNVYFCLRQVFTSLGNLGIIYSVSWSPTDMNCIAASRAEDGIFILNVKEERVVKRFKEVCSCDVK